MPAIPARIPSDEPQRLAALRRYDILDTVPEPAFDDLAKLAAFICGTETAHISLIDEDRQWLKSRVGIGADETPRDLTFCSHAILETNVFVVPDACEDVRFATHPFVVGEPRLRFYAGAPLRTSDGHALGTICVVDQKPRVLAPHQLAALEALSRQVMAQLELRRANARLAEAKTEAERANRAKTEFLARVNHDVRTPLMVIQGYADIVRENPDAADRKDCLHQISRAADHILTLVNSITDISRIESGRVELAPERLDVCDTIDRVVEMVRPIAAERHVTIEVDSDVRLPDVVADRSRTIDILLNLLSNGIKYNREHGRLCISPTLDVSGRVRINVTDTGFGIPTDKLSRVFQPYDRLGAEQTTIKGTGLGLASARRWAEAMGGTMGVESVEGVGSTFFVTLPAAERQYVCALTPRLAASRHSDLLHAASA